MKIKDGNYLTIQSFMVTELKLKGNELLVYAIIYGFSQNNEDKFTGSLQYICEWTNSTKQGILKSLKSLIEKNLIIKNEIYKNGIKFVEYYATEFTTIKQSLPPNETKFNDSIKQSLPNNILINNIEKNIYNNIINYLNNSCSKHYKPNIAKTKKLIDARIKEGFTEDDFKKVIDNKKAQWLNDEKMNQYLRPETLFGTKFESYLNTETSNNNIKDDDLI